LVCGFNHRSLALLLNDCACNTHYITGGHEDRFYS
jgi:hypothetical protein